MKGRLSGATGGDRTAPPDRDIRLRASTGAPRSVIRKRAARAGIAALNEGYRTPKSPLWDEIVSELPARLFIPEPLGRPRLVIVDARIGHTGENRRGQEAAMIVFMIISLLWLEPLGWLLSTGLIRREVMQAKSPRNSLNGLGAM